MSSEEATVSAVGLDTPFNAPVSSSLEDNKAKQDDSIPAPIESNVTDDDSSTDMDDSDAEIEPEEPVVSGEEALMAATVLKEEGNVHFQSGNWDLAARCYRRGVNRLKKLSGPDADAQVTALQLTLQTNLSMVLFKQGKFRNSRDVASRAIKLDANHVKALYRRALACAKMGDVDLAKADLRAALQVDPNNAACKKELASIKKQADQATQQQKSALARAFSSNKSSFLYDDKEKEEEEKLLEKERLAKEEAKRKESRRKQWEDDCVSRMAKGGQAISFDDWIKEQDAAEKKKKKEEEKKRKEAEKLRRKAQKASSSSSSSVVKDDSDDELTQQELASLRGYKKTKDGRTTSYFTRELSEDEKQKLGDTAPKKLDSSSTAPALISSNTDSPMASSSADARPSVWNQAGTWEEKDCTAWCKESLTEHLQSTLIKSAKITKLEELTGEGSVAITGGKKRYIFDFHAKMKYKIFKADCVGGSDDNNNEVASGVLRLPDICSTHYEDDELEVSFESLWTKTPAPDQLDACLETRVLLANELRQSVQKWVQQFNQQF